MQRRATSIKRAAEAEKEVDMGDKEATPVEDPEVLVNPVEPKQPAPSEEPPEVTTQTGEVNLQEKKVEKAKGTEESKLDRFMEMFLQRMEGMDKNMEENSKKLSEDLNNKLDSTNKKMDSTKEDLGGICLLYTSRCV